MPGSLTAQQIVTRALQRAKCPGFTAQGGQALNSILEALCQTYDLALARATYSAVMPVGLVTPQALPADFLRISGKDIFYIDPLSPGVPRYLTKAWLENFDMLINQPGLASYPEEYATDLSVAPPTISFWPPAQGAYTWTMRYFRQMPSIATPETSSTIPWFPNSEYLIDRLTASMMVDTNMEEAERLEARAAARLKPYLVMKDDPEGIAKTVKLDPRRYRTPQAGLLPTKLTDG